MTGCVLGEVERGDDRKHDCCYDIVLYEGNLYKGLRTKRLISQNGNSVPCHFSDASLFRPLGRMRTPPAAEQREESSRRSLHMAERTEQWSVGDMDPR